MYAVCVWYVCMYGHVRIIRAFSLEQHDSRATCRQGSCLKTFTIPGILQGICMCHGDGTCWCPHRFYINPCLPPTHTNPQTKITDQLSALLSPPPTWAIWATLSRNRCVPMGHFMYNTTSQRMASGRLCLLQERRLCEGPYMNYLGMPFWYKR